MGNLKGLVLAECSYYVFPKLYYTVNIFELHNMIQLKRDVSSIVAKQLRHVI